MNALEHSLFVTSIALEKDHITMTQLREVIATILSASPCYVPEDGREPQQMINLSEALGRRYEYLIYPGGITEGEDDGLK